MKGYLVLPGLWLAIGLVLTAPAGAAEIMKHSGSIVSIADDATTFRLAEVGPWRVRDGVTVLTYRTITLTPETVFAGITRVDKAPSGFAGDFVQTPLGFEDLYLNDHVTVECRHEGTRLIALKVVVTNWPAPDTGGPR